ncbi:hypothetical protein CEXT_349921 [Caerostris extrusa]|uniref:Uncharacterized protein n=1 Tax=Caerostris extrusa TaxID=172846 RepID=A0AAV4MV77_CAEEX|nr:hypothetical protein CEXT_349921 [Caerostris extrusa]
MSGRHQTHSRTLYKIALDFKLQYAGETVDPKLFAKVAIYPEIFVRAAAYPELFLSWGLSVHPIVSRTVASNKLGYLFQPFTSYKSTMKT